jgi:hypothetical protein
MSQNLSLNKKDKAYFKCDKNVHCTCDIVKTKTLNFFKF